MALLYYCNTWNSAPCKVAALVLKPEDPQREPGQNPSKYHEGIYGIYLVFLSMVYTVYCSSIHILILCVYIYVYIYTYIYMDWHSKGRMSIMVAISSSHPTWNIVKSAILRKSPPSLDVPIIRSLILIHICIYIYPMIYIYGWWF